jgi:carbon starvation protein
LAAVALCVATTIIIKMGRPRYAVVTLAPLAWLVSVAFTASWHKIFHPNPRIGLLSHARMLAAEVTTDPARAHEIARLIFNDRLDAVVAGLLISLVLLLMIESGREWLRVLSGRKAAVVKEAAFVPSRFAAEESS